MKVNSQKYRSLTPLKKWYFGLPLPQPYYAGTLATVDNTAYLLGRYSQDGESKHVFSVCLEDLISDLSKPKQTSTSVSPTPTPPSSLQELCRVPQTNRPLP